MPVYAVNYDLNRPNQDYSGLIAELERSPGYLHYLKSGWLIATGENANQLMSRLQPFIDGSDRILVIGVTSDYRGFLTEDQWQWIRRHV